MNEEILYISYKCKSRSLPYTIVVVTSFWIFQLFVFFFFSSLISDTTLVQRLNFLGDGLLDLHFFSITDGHTYVFPYQINTSESSMSNLSLFCLSAMTCASVKYCFFFSIAAWVHVRNYKFRSIYLNEVCAIILAMKSEKKYRLK